MIRFEDVQDALLDLVIPAQAGMTCEGVGWRHGSERGPVRYTAAGRPDAGTSGRPRSARSPTQGTSEKSAPWESPA
jgi:hypothetical protein